ncbi:MAG TPA: hypothetical protein VGG02_12145 [Chthoniobacterales bacterium]|jgi:hypothetical protein
MAVGAGEGVVLGDGLGVPGSVYGVAVGSGGGVGVTDGVGVGVTVTVGVVNCAVAYSHGNEETNTGEDALKFHDEIVLMRLQLRAQAFLLTIFRRTCIAIKQTEQIEKL